MTAEELRAAFDALREQRDTARRERDELRAQLDRLARVLCPVIERHEALAPASTILVDARAAALAALLRDLAPKLSDDQRADLTRILTEETP